MANNTLQEAFEKQIKALPNTDKLYYYEKSVSGDVLWISRKNYEDTLKNYMVESLPKGSAVVPSLVRKAGMSRAA